MGKFPLVSVCLITYNHEKYICKAIEGVLQQETLFPFELIIADDCSTDNTRSIIKEYANSHPSIIRLILQEKNVGAKRNWLDLIESPKGKYIAYFEGDDYWIDPLKLDKQVKFLEENANYSACCSNVFEEYEDGQKKIASGKSTITLNDLAYGNIIYTSSVLYRNIIDLPSWLNQCKMGDWILWLLLAQKGPIFKFEEQMCVYRIHNNSLWSSAGKEKNLKDIILTYEILFKNLNHDVKKELKRGANIHYNQLLEMLMQTKSPDFFWWYKKALLLDGDTRKIRYLFRYLRNKLIA
jgi:glycosyltransferase involved in cell wall biosynthesis